MHILNWQILKGQLTGRYIVGHQVETSIAPLHDTKCVLCITLNTLLPAYCLPAMQSEGDGSVGRSYEA